MQPSIEKHITFSLDIFPDVDRHVEDVVCLCTGGFLQRELGRDVEHETNVESVHPPARPPLPARVERDTPSLLRH